MKTNFFKEWLNAICYSTPRSRACIGNWIKFAEKASYSRVEKAFYKVRDLDYFDYYQDVIEVLLNRLARGNWPNFSDDFIAKNNEQIFKVKSMETAKDEISDSDDIQKAKYLVDENNQMLGIVVCKNVIITGLVYDRVSLSVIKSFVSSKRIPSKEQVAFIKSNILYINRMLYEIGCVGIAQAYWYDKRCNIYMCNMSDYHVPLIRGIRYAQLLFIV
jgi:hypothetical protein